ncbi:MAG TPA: lipocalin-like domain-containing protein [Burkholderiales bacterium]|nr:lipocalin-like domain-containing protein [Burkholderiales bacterium]
MNRPSMLAATAASILFVSLAMPAGNSAAQDSKSLIGTWTAVASNTIDASGKRTPIFGPNPRGSLIFAPNGHYSLMLARASLPKFTSNSRERGSAEENKSIVAGSISHYGKYTVNDFDKTLTFHVETSTYPNWDGSAQKRPFTVSGDRLTYRVAEVSSGAGSGEVVWKRVK